MTSAPHGYLGPQSGCLAGQTRAPQASASPCSPAARSASTAPASGRQRALGRRAGPGVALVPRGSSRHVPSLFRQRREGNGRQPSTAGSLLQVGAVIINTSPDRMQSRLTTSPSSRTRVRAHAVAKVGRGTSGARRPEICWEATRTVEISSAGQTACEVRSSRSATRLH